MNHITEFYGYRRLDGGIGVRNHVLVIAAMDNSNPVARRIAASVQGVIPIVAGFGRGQVGEDLKLHDRTLIGLGTNPNTASVLVISLEPDSAKRIAEGIADTGRPVEWFSIQQVGGTVKALEKGIRITSKFATDAGKIRRELAPLSKLTIGVKCGGSDTTSGLVSNPVTGMVADIVVGAGGTVIQSEPEEVVGAEQIMARKSASPEVSAQLLAAIERHKRQARHLGMQLTTLAPDNIAGGLSTMNEKSLGAIRKGGTSLLQEVIMLAQKPSRNGLIFMDAPGPATENTTASAASGSQIIIFTTGIGNPIGNPVAPTIKVCANPNAVLHSGDNIDVDISAVIKGEKSLVDASEILYQELLDVANGKMTQCEVLGDVEIAISRLESTFTLQ
jgi:altronate dehydratase large subunit